MRAEFPLFFRGGDDYIRKWMKEYTWLAAWAWREANGLYNVCLMSSRACAASSQPKVTKKNTNDYCNVSNCSSSCGGELDLIRLVESSAEFTRASCGSLVQSTMARNPCFPSQKFYFVCLHVENQRVETYVGIQLIACRDSWDFYEEWVLIWHTFFYVLRVYIG